MIELLLRLVKFELPGLLENPTTPWQGLDVTYEQPRVERLWTPVVDGCRLCLHRIHPCETPYWHNHPWPSAVIVVEGAQEVKIGAQRPEHLESEPPRVAATFAFSEAGQYEMLTEWGWHSVNPVDGPSLSVMLSGPPFRFEHVAARPRTSRNGELAPANRASLLHAFRHCEMLKPPPTWRRCDGCQWPYALDELTETGRTGEPEGFACDECLAELRSAP